MLGYILNNLDKYPLDAVINFDLEIDWGFTSRCAEKIGEMCKKANIPFYRIKPRKTFFELVEKYGLPTRVGRWCNSKYKLDCYNQLKQILLQKGCRPVAYIGYCADEYSRYYKKYSMDNQENKINQDEIYPLVEANITEYEILEWATHNPMFEGWYEHFVRQGCCVCPMAHIKEVGYLYLHEREWYDKLIEWENKYCYKSNGTRFYFRKPTAEEEEKYYNRVKTKWVDIIKKEEEMAKNGDYSYLETDKDRLKMKRRSEKWLEEHPNLK